MYPLIDHSDEGNLVPMRQSISAMLHDTTSIQPQRFGDLPQDEDGMRI